MIDAIGVRPSHALAVRERCIHPSGAFEPFPAAAIGRTVAARFEEIVRRHPGRLALRTSARRLTYDDLNRAANRIALALLDRLGEGAEPVGLLMERDVSVIAATIALAKAGKIAVPLDATFPEARLIGLLADCRPRALLTTTRSEGLARRLVDSTRAVLNVETLDGAGPAGDPSLTFDGETLAYILYTSGSTGQPKGVAHSHFGLLHQIRRHTNVLRIGVEDRVSMLGSPSAAQANTLLFVALLNGAALFPRDLKEDGIGGLAGWLAAERITYCRTSASIFRHWARHLGPGDHSPSLRLLAVGGEPVYRQDFELYRARFGPECLFVNVLSTTETGTLRIQLLDRDSRFEGHIVPAGHALDDTEVLLLDEAGAQVAQGEVGEIAVRSRGLAVGYWGDEAMTRARFSSHPEDRRLRTYRTGDLGQMAADGALVQLGRRDSLVKISGQRIDVGEVEAALRESDMVTQAAVVDRDDARGHKRLVAYVVPGAAPLRPAALRRFLRDRLPEHMIPSGIQAIDALPLTPSGKIDRQALPRFDPPAPSGAAVGHLGLLGTQLRAIWEELLGVTGVGPQDDFVDLGGDSLLGMEMLMRVEKVCGRPLAPSRLLGGAITIERLVRLLMEDERPRFDHAVAAVQPGGTRPPLFFLHGDHEHGGLYCHALARALGPDQPFFAVAPHGLDGDALPWSIEVMAADRLAAVRAVRPGGPYRLGGFCTGGVIAFEMACQLEAQGERVETLLLVDANLENPAPLARRLGRVTRRLAAALRWSEATRRGAHLQLRRLAVAHGELERDGLRGAARLAADVVRGVRRRLRGTAVDGDETLDEAFGAYLARHRAYGVRRRDYVPGRYGGRVALFRSDFLLSKPVREPTAGWRHVAGHVDVHWLPGTHQSAVTRHVAVVAEKMRPYLA